MISKYLDEPVGQPVMPNGSDFRRSPSVGGSISRKISGDGEMLSSISSVDFKTACGTIGGERHGIMDSILRAHDSLPATIARTKQHLEQRSPFPPVNLRSAVSTTNSQPHAKRPRLTEHLVPESYGPGHRPMGLSTPVIGMRHPIRKIRKLVVDKPDDLGYSLTDGIGERNVAAPQSDLLAADASQFHPNRELLKAIRIKSPVSSLKFTTNSQPNHHHLLLKSGALTLDTGLPTPPVLTSSLGHAFDDSKMSQAQGEDGLDLAAGAKPIDLSVDLSGPQLPNLLSHMPPLKPLSYHVDGHEGSVRMLERVLEDPKPSVHTYRESSTPKPDHPSQQVSSTSDVRQGVARRIVPQSSSPSDSLAAISPPRVPSAAEISRDILDPRSVVGIRSLSVGSDPSIVPNVLLSYSQDHSRDILDEEVNRLQSSSSSPPSNFTAKSSPSRITKRFSLQDCGTDSHWISNLIQKVSSKMSLLDPQTQLTQRAFGRGQRATQKRPVCEDVEPLVAEHPLSHTKVSNLPQWSADRVVRKAHSGEDYQRRASETFTKVILDLEDLLGEALLIARQAAERADVEELQSILEEASLVVKSNKALEQDLEARSSGMTTTQSPAPANHPVENPKESMVLALEAARPSIHHSSGICNNGQSQAHFPTERLRQNTQIQTEQLHLDPCPWEAASECSVSGPPAKSIAQSPLRFSQPTDGREWAFSASQGSLSGNPNVSNVGRSSSPRPPVRAKSRIRDQMNLVIRSERPQANTLSKEAVREHIRIYKQPPVQPRVSSTQLRSQPFEANEAMSLLLAKDPVIGHHKRSLSHGPRSGSPSIDSLSGYQFTTVGGFREHSNQNPGWEDAVFQREPQLPSRDHGQYSNQKGISLRDRHHFSVCELHGFSLSRSHRRQPIARDWNSSRKRSVATVTCINTALLGLIVGIYAGEVPAMQYRIVDFHHYTILGNVFLYIGLAIPTLVFWPLPLLHGRKPYTLTAFALLLPLQFPQALVVGSDRSPYVATYRIGLLLARAASGFVLGFANINFKVTLLDLFGSSLQSRNPHQEIVNEHDVRRHGGGMGLWLGIWTWCHIGSIGLGFFIGALVISGLDPSWGFWIVVILIAAVLFLNVITPEVRRSPYRRSVAKIRSGTDISRRAARGEVKMHLEATSPKWWWEEVGAGLTLCNRMLMQRGFIVLSLYLAWIYGQVVMVMVLLGALTSKYYRFQSQYVGLCVFAIPLGGLLAIPFQKSSFFSRSRIQPPRTDSMTFQRRVTWSSHLLRRIIFMIVLPFADLGYTLSSAGPPTPVILPTIFAALIGFLSNLAIAECHGLIMETYDTSDLQPGMTGRPRSSLPEDVTKKRTNFSCYPRVCAGSAISQTFSFLIAAAATGVGGAIERRLGAQAATGVVAGVLLILTLLLMLVLWRFKDVEVIPSRTFINRPHAQDDGWRPVIIGNPSGRLRRMNVLEMGEQSRWTEIRRRNRLIEMY
ncbi:MAG: hypothetical protein M1827_001304 [Pycnora praestabilis]|nr:MAG: hypothetical protein M1827_001304 [Pycnora praestabilis]